MRIVLFDPNLARFGHHVHFNAHVLKLLGRTNADITYLDVGRTMQSAGSFGAVAFYNLTEKDLGGSRDVTITSEEALDAALRRDKSCKALWEKVAGLEPSLIILTSEGKLSHALLSTMPDELASRVYVTIHVVWSLLQKCDQGHPIEQHLRRCGGLFVLEPFLLDPFLLRGTRCFWLPHRSFDRPTQGADAIGRKPSGSLRLGTIGVINERRNHDFLLKTMGSLSNTPCSYLLAGELMPSVSANITQAIADFPANGPVKLQTELGYLEDDRFQELVDGIDAALLAYDMKRNLQASGAVYSMAERGVVTIAPATSLFKAYERIAPGLVRLYPPLDRDGLANALQDFDRDLRRSDFAEDVADARVQFLRSNSLDVHGHYLSELLHGLAGVASSTTQLLDDARTAITNGYFAVAEGMALATLSLGNPHSDAVDFAIRLRRKSGDLAGASKLQTVRARLFGQTGGSNPPKCTFREAKLGTILVWPPFENGADLSTFLARFAWHFASIAHHVEQVHVFTSDDYSAWGDVDSAISSAADAKNDYFEGKIAVRPSSMLESVELDPILFNLIWRYGNEEERRFPLPRESRYKSLYNKPIWRVDESNERFASSFFLKAVSDAIDTSPFRAQSAADFKALAKTFRNGKVAVFGTGPSLSSAMQRDFSGVDTIAANSMVKNIGLLDHLQPKLIVCADPIFHAGASVYAEEFRQQLRFALKRYRCPLMVPERDRHIYEHYFEGEDFTLMSVPFAKQELPNYNMTREFFVATTGNILTLFLLQVAYSYVDEVEIWGCDGRPAHENSYFWSHDKSAQINEHMTAIQRAHPGFFKISYDDYYSEHCTTLERFLSHAESLGKKVHSCSFSHIPALVKRQTMNSKAEQSSLTSIEDSTKKSPHLARSMSMQSVSKCILGAFPREDEAHVDETGAVSAYLAGQSFAGNMIDVGAHHGSAFIRFLDRDWSIWAFEPDRVNRSRLEARLQSHKNASKVTLDTRCVSNVSESNLPFYQSQESTGISGLSAFRDTHREAQRVDTVSLRDYFAGKEMPEVDFLKIDTEGHDLFVLHGFPWDRNKPKVIECEFEDLKTKPLGYTTQDMADFLAGKGYTVYVSEWHPILRYGQKHDWHRLQKYPCHLASDDAWGNLLAFLKDADESALTAAFRKFLKYRGPTPVHKQGAMSENDSHYAPVFEHTTQFSNLNPREWLLCHETKAKQQLLVAKFSCSKIRNRKYFGLIFLKSDQRMNIALSFGRVGNKPYEGSSMVVELEAGEQRGVVVSHYFKEDHLGVKIQLDVKKCAGKEAKIRIDTCALLTDGRDLLAEQSGEMPIVVRANQLFREQKYADCIPLYLAASRRTGFKALEFNAHLALRRLGINDKDLTTKILQELSESPAPNGNK